MTESSVPDRRTISNVALTLAVVGGLILSYFLAIPFLPAIVWSVTLGVLFAPLDVRLRRSIRSATISAAATVFGSLTLARLVLGLDEQATVTVTFLTLAFGQLWHVFNMRHQSSRLILNEISRNPWIWVALALCTSILLTAAYVPSLSYMLHMVAPDIRMWGIIIAMSAAPLLAGPIVRRLVRLFDQNAS